MRGHIDPTRPHATTPIPTRSDASSGHPAFPRGDDEVVPPLLRSHERPQGAILAPGIVQVLDQSPLPGERPGGAREPAPHRRDCLPTRMRTDRVARFLAELQARQLLVTSGSGPLKPHNWDVRQPQSDRVADRVSRYRQITYAMPDRPEVTLRGDGPPVAAYVPELEREEETDIPPDPPSGGSG